MTSSAKSPSFDDLPALTGDTASSGTFSSTWVPTWVTTWDSTTASSYYTPSANYWLAENRFTEDEREALIGTVIDSIIAAAVTRLPPARGRRSARRGIPKPLESKSPGLLHVPEGVGVDSEVWPGFTGYRAPHITTTTTWSTSSGATYTTDDAGNSV